MTEDTNQLEVSIKSIKVGNRIRKQVEGIDLLKNSIAKFGLVHPIVVDKNYQLLSGYRRLEAIKQLGWGKAPIKILTVGNLGGKEWEIEENLCRKNFSDQELEVAKKILQSINNGSIVLKLCRTMFFPVLFLFRKIFRK